MSQLVENYLYELYLYEELLLIDENFITWAKRFKEDKLKKFGEKMKKALDRKDMEGVRSIASKMPDPSMDKLEKMAKKASPNFKKAKKEASKKIGMHFAGIPEVEHRVLTFIVAIINSRSDEVVKGVGETIKKLKKLVKTPKVKKLGGGGEGAVGTAMLIGAFMIGLGAFLTISFPFLMLALLLAGLAAVFFIEGARQHGAG